MTKQRIKRLKCYRELLFDIKKLYLQLQIGEEVENKIPSNEKHKQKILTLYK